MRICAIGDLPPGRAAGFELVTPQGPLPILLLRQGDGVRAFENRCPHTGIGLDWNPGEFMDVTGTLLQCATHGALFRPADGYCIAGPCRGRSLQAVGITLIGDQVHLDRY